jgi:hypothetical protein
MPPPTEFGAPAAQPPALLSDTTQQESYLNVLRNLKQRKATLDGANAQPTLKAINNKLLI